MEMKGKDSGKSGVIWRFAVLGVLWVMLVGYLVTHARITLYTVFVIIASAIIIFVPMYKKYIKGKR